ncbi:MAG: hypothetical protein PUB99_05210 [Oscillospiraceae bacterium]|nr:hypothetical protein [Oscillospiraceae bacterium]
MHKAKIFCAVPCCAAILTASACGKTEAPQTTAEPQTSVQPVKTSAPAQSGEVPSAAVTDVEGTSEEESTQPVEIHLEDGLNSTDVAQVLAFYKLAAAKNDTNKYTKKLTLVSIDGGEGRIGSLVSYFEPIAQTAVKNNSVTNDPLPGDYKNIRPSDWQSATAVSDGTYTTITVKVVPQTDGADGKLLEGSVGRSMSVLDGIPTAVAAMPGVSADFENGKVELEYLNPTIQVKINNRTGEFVQGGCKWYYRVHPTLYTLDGKVLGMKVHLKNATGYVDYTVTY